MIWTVISAKLQARWRQRSAALRVIPNRATIIARCFVSLKTDHARLSYSFRSKCA